MTNAYCEHPSEEALERFLLHRSEDQEVEVLETHILACESCITRLETMETELATLKTALVSSEEERIQKELNPAASSWKSWFTIPRLSWGAAACAALAIGLVSVPHTIHKSQLSSPGGAVVAEGDLSACRSADGADTDLSTCRGAETATLPEGRPLSLRIDTTDIPEGSVDVQVVNGGGSEIWHGQTTVTKERAQLKLPQISHAGPYFLRFYAPSANAEHELLREYRFEVK
ncbi:MAG TPA: hypothetical protein VHZ55_26095 [Bryobacteraceae bacterium]|jgi:hypothetical protein|nr:hypothetical protein [Bryobacteraceae bacterium]